MKKLLTLGMALVMLLACVGAVSANLVSNGGFENSGAIPAQGFLPSPPGVLNDWTIVNTVDVIGLYWQPATGSQSLDLAGNAPGEISQVLTTTPSAKYDLSFNLSGNPAGAPKLKKVQVFWGGASQGIFSFDTTNTNLNSMGWVKTVIPGLVAPGASTELRFVDVSGTDFYGAALDDIVVEPQESTTPVPEFPTVALPAALIVGLIGAVLFIQKSKEE